MPEASTMSTRRSAHWLPVDRDSRSGRLTVPRMRSLEMAGSVFFRPGIAVESSMSSDVTVGNCMSCCARSVANCGASSRIVICRSGAHRNAARTLGPAQRYPMKRDVTQETKLARDTASSGDGLSSAAKPRIARRRRAEVSRTSSTAQNLSSILSPGRPRSLTNAPASRSSTSSLWTNSAGSGC
ncbi:unnamed protein product [Mycena citricolor]|uniref:Uncharacterized protein n=1 Tax=Mycena citricolor TaxID=2018698 RepID=A0AAD2HWK3_9AGAR|nr:unnamed protein product [Mycena citricolor]